MEVRTRIVEEEYEYISCNGKVFTDQKRCADYEEFLTLSEEEIIKLFDKFYVFFDRHGNFYKVNELSENFLYNHRIFSCRNYLDETKEEKRKIELCINFYKNEDPACRYEKFGLLKGMLKKDYKHDILVYTSEDWNYSAPHWITISYDSPVEIEEMYKIIQPIYDILTKGYKED